MNATCAPRRARRGAILIRQTQLQTIHPPSNNRNCHTAHNTDNQCSQHWHDVVTYMTSCNIAFCHNTHSAQLSTLRQLWKFRESFQVWQTCQCSTSPQLQTLTWPTHSSSHVMPILYHNHHQMHDMCRRILWLFPQFEYIGIINIYGGLSQSSQSSQSWQSSHWRHNDCRCDTYSIDTHGAFWNTIDKQ